jgi:hypothetical protein
MTRYVVPAAAASVVVIVSAFAADVPSQTKDVADPCRPQIGGRLVPGRPLGGIHLRGPHSNGDDENDDDSSHRLPACPSPNSVK